MKENVLTLKGRSVGSNPAVRTISRHLEKRLVSSPFMLMHKRAYSNDNRVFVLPALNWTEMNQKQFSLIQLGKLIQFWFSEWHHRGGTVNPVSKMWFSIRTTTSSRPITRTRGNGTHLTPVQRIWANHIETWVRFPSPAPFFITILYRVS